MAHHQSVPRTPNKKTLDIQPSVLSFLALFGLKPSLKTCKHFVLIAESTPVDFHELRQGFSPRRLPSCTRTCLTINQPLAHPIKNTGHLAQCSLVLRVVRVETLPSTAPCGQYMEALRANRGVHASGLSRTQAGLQPAPTLPLTRT